MKPWVRVSENTFQFCSFEAGYESIQEVKDPILSKVLTFQIHELKTLKVSIPSVMVPILLECEDSVEKKITPEVYVPMEPPPTVRFSHPENFVVPGLPLVDGFHLNFEFGFQEGDFERFNSIKWTPSHNLKSILDSNEKAVILGDEKSFQQVLASFYRSVYQNENFEKIYPLLKMSSSYSCFALPCLSHIKDRDLLNRFWRSVSSFEYTRECWNRAEYSELTFEKKMTLPFDLLYADYLVNKENSPYFDAVIEHTRKFFYGYQLFMTLTCFRMLLSCVFSTPFKPESSITRIFPDLEEPESLWNLFRSDPSFRFLKDSSFFLDFNFGDSNEELYTYLMDIYGPQRIKQMWVNILAERLPTAAGLKVTDPKKAITEIFDRRMAIHHERDWKSFLDDPEFGLVWSITYNTSPKLRHEYRRIMVNHFTTNGGISL